MRRVFLLLGACLVMSLVFAPAAETQTCPEGRVAVQNPDTGDFTCKEGLLPLQDPETGDLTCPEGQVRVQDPETEEVLCFEGQKPLQDPETTNEPCREGQELVSVGERAEDICVTAEQTEQERAAMNRLDAENLCPEGQVPVQEICLTGQLPETDPQTGELTCSEGQVLVSVGESERKNACVTAPEQRRGEEPLYEDTEETAPETGELLPEQQVPQEAEPSDTSTAQYEDDDVPALPDTGGPSLGVFASVLGVSLLAGGLLLRRRLS